MSGPVPSSRQSIRDLLTGDSGSLSEVIRHATRLRRLDRAFRKLLPGPAQAHCRVANLRGDTLVVAADSPVWASRIRYESRQILREMAASCGVTASKLQILVRSPEAPESQASRARKLPQNAARSLEAAAAAVDDPELTAALLRLASRARS
ncbi:MAG: DUF721 domain-containing protein [Gammaproteobacteria bacterium]|nr:MAG: DUF721 domain-containing protein [Gammaproteobacteria bacterium]